MAVLSLLWPNTSSADVMPQGMRSIDYKLIVVNLDEFPDYVFYAFPTTNYGVAYILEKGKGVSRLLLQKHGMVSRLWAIRRAELDRLCPKRPHYRHGDDYTMVELISFHKCSLGDAPVQSSLAIEPPLPVDEQDPVYGLERHVRILRVSPTAFEVELVKEVKIGQSGQRDEVGLLTAPTKPEPSASAELSGADSANEVAAGPSATAPPVATGPPASGKPSSGCAGCTAAAAAAKPSVWLLVVALLGGIAASMRRRS